MAVENPQNVAKKISETILKKKKIVLGDILEDCGYAESTCKKPKLVTETKAFKKAIKPLAEGLGREIERIKRELSTRDLSKEKYAELTRSLDILIKNHQLLNGGETERSGIVFKVTKYDGDNDPI
jgi:hypothetical protein